MDEEDDLTLGDVEQPEVGPCQKCQFFDVDRHGELVDEETLAPCLHPDLEEFELVVSGDSGCNLFEPWDGADDEDEDDEE